MATTEEESMAKSSIIDSLGIQITSVMTPVSITMLLVVFLLSSSPFDSSPPVSAATLIYVESPSDSTSQKLIGSVLDAIAFVILIAVATFVLVLLYYYNFTGFLKNYLRFSVFFVLTSLGGSIFGSLLQRFSIPLDAPTSVILLLNFSILGVLSVFSQGFPILLRQSYMVAVAVLVAVWFARLPEWTTWTLLVALAIYDLVAVLSPRGPLRILVELASSRDDELPALVYEARPNVPSSPSVSSSLGSVELQPVSQISNSTTIDEQQQEQEERSPFISSSQTHNSSNPNPPIPLIDQITQPTIEIEPTESETSPLVSRQIQRLPLSTQQPTSQQTETESESELDLFDSSRGIRLGLGDFIFYSVLVGRAAMYDLMTVYACYLAIVSGLGCTLILLSVFRRALPALPISISLGVCFYFLTRVLMEPFVVGASTNLVMF